MKKFYVLLIILSPLGLFGQVYNVMTYANNNEIASKIRIKTQIPISATQQPKIHIDGYELNLGPILLDIGWYADGGTFWWASASSAGSYAPYITLSVVDGKINIFLDTYTYAPRFTITAYAEGLGESSSWFTGWSVKDTAMSGTQQTPANYYNFFQGSVGVSGLFNTSYLSSANSNFSGKSYFGGSGFSPKEMIQVNGNIILEGNARSFRFNTYDFGGTPKFLSNGYASALKFDTSGSLYYSNTATSGIATNTATLNSALAIDKNGKTGIGTSTPKELLQVNGNITTSGNNKSYRFNTYYNSGNKFLASGYGGAFTFDSTGTLYFANTSSSGSTDGAASLNNVFAITKDGKIGVGTSSPAETLSVNGNILSKKVKVIQTGWADYVFKPDYHLKPLDEVEEFIRQNGHLPEVPSQVQIEASGLDVGDNQATLLKKIEELTLYIIEQDKRIKKLESQNKK